MPLSFTKDRREGLAKTLDNLAVAAYVAGASLYADYLPHSEFFNWWALLGLGAVLNFLAFVLRYEQADIVDPSGESQQQPEAQHDEQQ